MFRVQLSGRRMAALKTAPEDLAVPYEAPRQQRMVAAAQPRAPKKDCVCVVISARFGNDCSPPSGSKGKGDARHTLGWILRLVPTASMRIIM